MIRAGGKQTISFSKEKNYSIEQVLIRHPKVAFVTEFSHFFGGPALVKNNGVDVEPFYRALLWRWDFSRTNAPTSINFMVLPACRSHDRGNRSFPVFQNTPV